MYNKVDISGINTSSLTVLSGKEKQKLLEKAVNGDRNARTKLINGNLRLVLSVVQSFACRGENPDDLFQVGCIGLIKAIDNFDLSLNVKFSTYAVPLISGEMRRFLRDNNSIRVSRSLRDLAYKTLRTREELSAKLQREPTIDEISSAMQVPKTEIINALEAISAPVSIYEPVYSDGTDSVYLLDQIKDMRNTDESWINSIALSDAIKKLDKREQKILALRFFRGKTQTEVANEIGISQAQVSRIEKTAIEKVKQQI